MNKKTTMNNKKLPWDEWFEKAKQVRTIEQFNELYEYLFNGDIQHTYDSAVHATSALAIAGGWLGSATEGITGFMAAHVKFDFLRQWDNIGKSVGLKVINYDDLLCPQYVEKFPLKVIKKNVWLALQRACKEKLEVDGRCACYKVRQYWGDICNGIIPSSLVVVDDYTDKVVIKVAPICVERPAHTIADMERDYNDEDSPWYDKVRHDEERRKFKEERESKHNSCCEG